MSGSERSGLRVTALATLWFVFLAVAATAPALFGNRSLGPEARLDADLLYAPGVPARAPPVYDATRVFYDVPRDFAAAEGMRHGRIDLWNPRVGFGMPLFAEGGGLFFPAKIPFYLAPSRRSYDVSTSLRLVIAGLGAFLLARRRGLAPVPAVAAGSFFELSGAMIATLQFGVGAPPCLLPWVLLGAQLIAEWRSAAAAAAAGLALGVAAHSGHPMLAVAVFAGFGTAILGHVVAAWRRLRKALAIVALAGLALTLGLAVAAPALMPLRDAQRTGRLYKDTAIFKQQLYWYRAQTRVALPVALFAPATLNGLREGLPIAFPYSLVVPAVGLFGLVLALAGLVQRGLDAALIAVGLLGVGMTVAPPILGSVGRLPLLDNVYPMYAWSLVALPLTQAAGKGVDVLSMRRAWWTVLVALAVVLAGGSSLVSGWYVFSGTIFAFPLRGVFQASLEGWTGWLCLVLPLALLPCVVVGLLVAARTRFGDRCALAATVLGALELLCCLAPTTWFPDSNVLGSPPSPAVRFLQQGLDGGQYRMLGSPRSLGLPATPSLFGLADVRGTAALPVERYARYLEAISPKARWYVWQFPGSVRRHPLLDLAGVRYVAIPARRAQPLLEGDAAVRLVYRDGRVAIYENDAVLPRARIVHAAEPVRDHAEAFARLVDAAKAAPHAAAAGLVSRVFIEPSADGHLAPEMPAEVPPDSESVQFVPGDDPDRVELEAVLSLPGWVVLADTFYPGWTATVDGISTPIHPTNLLFRGVFVAPGAHRIVFRYQPWVFRLAVVLAVFGLAVSALLLGRGARAAQSHPSGLPVPRWPATKCF